MEAVSDRKVVTLSLPKTQVHATELLATLAEYATKVKVLSLDCFDTIIWRKSATPTDVFYDLESRPSFKSLNITTILRLRTEMQARKDMLFNFGSNEVKLYDIYHANFPFLTKEQINELIEDELSLEHETCYAFPPVVELMRAAHQRGFKIVVVSDTYLTESQLRHLLKSKLPADAMAAINHIFCSCETGKSKVNGLFHPVISKLGVAANSVLHVGDNIRSDFHAAKKAGCHALHLILHPEQSFNEIQRMNAVIAPMLDPTIRNKRGLNSPYQGVLASTSHSYADAKISIGYATVGPIMYGFARFICDTVDELKQQGKQPKVLFLLRDAYLPFLACEALTGSTLGDCISISRFASFAATFNSKEKINRYLADNVTSLRFDDMCKQLLLPEEHAKEIRDACESAEDQAAEFVLRINRPNMLERIIQESAAYRQRMYRYLEKSVGLKRDDTLIFVDLGYSGTTQRELQPLFKEEMNIDIIGRYLIQMSVPGWSASRKGLLDPSWCDDRTLNTLVSYIALLEQLSTSQAKSVINYDNDGNPIYSNAGISANQYLKLTCIQAEVLRFIRDAKQFTLAANLTLEHEHLRDAALIALGRLLFLPTAVEIDYLSTFEFDLNLGTQDLIPVVDIKSGLTGLRKRGMMFMENNYKTMRTNYPSELRAASIELALTLMGALRFGYDIRVHDVSHRRECMQIIVMNGMHATQTTIDAVPTFDGYYALIAPVGSVNFQLGILFGLNYRWVQLESAELIKGDALYGSKETENTEDASMYLALDRMSDKGGGLFECHSDTGMVVFAGPKKSDGQNYVLRIVYRPLVEREPTPEAS